MFQILFYELIMANPWNGVRVNQPYTSLGPLGLLFQCARGGRDVPTPYPSAEFVIINHYAVYFDASIESGLSAKMQA